MGSPLFFIAASFVAAPMLFATRPTAAMRAFFVTASVTQPMAAAGSDATANRGVARASMLREDKPVYSRSPKPHSNCRKRVPNRPLRPRRGRV